MLEFYNLTRLAGLLRGRTLDLYNLTCLAGVLRERSIFGAGEHQGRNNLTCLAGMLRACAWILQSDTPSWHAQGTDGWFGYLFFFEGRGREDVFACGNWDGVWMG